MNLLLLAPGNSIHTKRWIDFHREKINYCVSLHPFREDISFKNKTFFSGNYFSFILNSIRLLILIKKNQINTIHVHSLARYGFFILPSCLLLNIKLISSPWGSDLVIGKDKLLNKYVLKYLLKRSEIIHVDAEHMLYKCEELSKGSSVKCKKIMYGINTELFKPMESSDKNSKVELKILSIRNHEDVYRIDLIIDALDELNKDSNIKFCFNILGSGTKTKDYKEKIKNSSLLNISNFLGNLSQKDMIQQINNNDIVISASRSDGGISSSIGEAMSCGKVVLASNGKNDENQLWIKDSVNGFLFKEGDKEDLISKLKFCSENIQMLDEIGLKARNKIKESNDIEKEMNKFKLIYESL